MRMNLRAAAMITSFAMCLWAGVPAHAQAGGESLRLRVGPGIDASIATATMHFSCSDDADCRFDVPRDSTFDVVARSNRARELRWTGCKSLPGANRCRVEVRDAVVLVTVR